MFHAKLRKVTLQDFHVSKWISIWEVLRALGVVRFFTKPYGKVTCNMGGQILNWPLDRE